jgi:Cu/Ag efflux pump CusA
LAIGVMGALCISVLLSLVATPTLYRILLALRSSAIAREVVPHNVNPP